MTVEPHRAPPARGRTVPRQRDPHASPTAPATHLSLADAAVALGVSVPELIHRLRLDMVADLVYVPGEDGWYLPRLALGVLELGRPAQRVERG